MNPISDGITYDLVLAALKDIVGIPSVSLNEQALASYLKTRLSNAGLDARIDRHGNMIAKKRFARPGKTFYFNSHMDTVDVGNNWTRDPYGCETRGGRLYGVGACDCKGSLTGMVIALEAIAQSGVELSGEMGITAVAREQYQSVEQKGTANLIADGFQADMVVIGEPSCLTICRGCEGMAEVEITVKGVPVHGSNPEKGVNAIDVMLEIMREAKKLPIGRSEILDRGALNFGVITGGTRSCVVADGCSLKLARFLVEGETGAAFLGQIREILGRVKASDSRIGAEAVLTYDTLAGVVPDGAPVIEVLRRATERVVGKPAGLTAMRAHMDADFLINTANIPTVALGPGDLTAYDASDEWVDVNEVLTAAKIYVAAVQEALSQPVLSEGEARPRPY